MVATRALLHGGERDEVAELRRSLRDIVALSNLPAIWLRADAEQVATSLAQLAISVLDADFACVALDRLGIHVVEVHNRAAEAGPAPRPGPTDGRPPGAAFEVDVPGAGRMRGFSVPVGREGAASLTAFCRRPDFPTEPERLLLRIACGQAAVTIERWETERSLRAEISRREALERRQVRLLEEQSALYRFTDALFRAERSDRVHEAALDAITSALRCSRASILLFDEAGVMRFASWRGLSDRYRAAVDGHSPWGRDSRDPAPICVDSVAGSDIDEPLKRTILDEGIAALSFVPLVADGRVIGKFMAYYDEPHRFSEHEVDLAVTIARQLGFAIARDRLRAAGLAAEQALRESEARKAAILESALDAILAMDKDGRIVDFNPAAERLFGHRRQDVIGRTVVETIVPERQRATDHTGLASFLRSDRETATGQRVEFPALRADGSEVETELTVAASKSGDANVRFIACIRDITERKRADAQRELLVAELNHRVKNTLANVIAIGHQSFARGRSPEEAWGSFGERVRALAQTHARLAEAHWATVPLEALVLDELRPYRPSGTHIVVQGPYLGLGAKRAISLGMAIHELATNAAKHGALSTRDGSLAVTWRIADGEAVLSWLESGGPPVQPPRRSGFGQFLLERALAIDLEGTVDLSFPAEGARCVITFPLHEEVARAAAGTGSAIAACAPPADARPACDQPLKRTSTTAPRILVVEDEFLLALEIQEVLSANGYAVVGPCRDLAEASQALGEEIDLAVLDTNLNGVMVFPLADELVRRGIPCLFVTGYDASNLPERFRSFPKLSKPYDPSVLRSRIRSVLSRRGEDDAGRPGRKARTGDERVPPSPK